MFNSLLLLTSLSTSTSISENVETPTTNTPATIDWTALIKYGVFVIIILLSLILIAVVRRAIKKEASLTKTKRKAIKALEYAKKILNYTNKKDLLIASTKLATLATLISEATWNATRVVEEKKDVALESILNSLNSISSLIGDYSEEAFYTKNEYVNNVSRAVNVLETVISDIDHFVETHKSK